MKIREILSKAKWMDDVQMEDAAREIEEFIDAKLKRMILALHEISKSDGCSGGYGSCGAANSLVEIAIEALEEGNAI